MNDLHGRAMAIAPTLTESQRHWLDRIADNELDVPAHGYLDGPECAALTKLELLSFLPMADMFGEMRRYSATPLGRAVLACLDEAPPTDGDPRPQVNGQAQCAQCSAWYRFDDGPHVCAPPAEGDPLAEMRAYVARIEPHSATGVAHEMLAIAERTVLPALSLAESERKAATMLADTYQRRADAAEAALAELVAADATTDAQRLQWVWANFGVVVFRR